MRINGNNGGFSGFRWMAIDASWSYNDYNVYFSNAPKTTGDKMIKHIWRKLRGLPTIETLTIYMKSGNKIVLDNITDWNVAGTAEAGVTNLKLTWRTSARTKLIITSVPLNQIEAITVSKD